MKTYLRTYDVYRKIVEEEKKRFTRKKDNQVYYWDKYDRELLPEDKTVGGYKVIELDELWEEVKEPVDFIEAINSGKCIKPADWTTDYWDLSILMHALSDYDDEDIREIIKGKWYIED